MGNSDTRKQLVRSVKFQRLDHRVTAVPWSRTVYVSLSIRFNSHFPCEPELAGTGMSSLYILLELSVLGIVLIRYKTSETPVKMSPPTKQHQFLQAGYPSRRPSNGVKALKGRYTVYVSVVTVYRYRYRWHLCDNEYLLCVSAAAEILCVETVVNPMQLYHDLSDAPAPLDEIKLLLTIRCA